MIADGRIGLVQYDSITHFTETGIKLSQGQKLDADLIVLATGYRGMSAEIERTFGSDVADKVGQIWGFSDDMLALRNMYCRTPQPGLWFMAGSFAQCRINSKYLALQIKACEEGLMQI